MKVTKNLGMLLLGIWLIVTGAAASGQFSDSSHRHSTGSARYRRGYFDPLWSIDFHRRKNDDVQIEPCGVGRRSERTCACR
jgi:hypothetical protein